MKRIFAAALLACIILLPLSIAVWSQTQHSITITWTYTQGTDIATGFKVWRSTVTGGPYTQISTTTLPITTLQFVDTVGVAGTKYFYVVTAVDAAGNSSPNSIEVSATFLGNPAIPAGVTAVAK